VLFVETLLLEHQQISEILLLLPQQLSKAFKNRITLVSVKLGKLANVLIEVQRKSLP
jgi:hypothetical protein